MGIDPTGVLEGPYTDVGINLYFGRSDAGVLCATGSIAGTIPLTCQRCLEPVLFALHTEARWGFITQDSEAEFLDPRYDPVLVTDEPMSFIELVEDELILALPAVPKHPGAACPLTGFSQRESELSATDRDGPFAVLGAQWKRNSKR